MRTFILLFILTLFAGAAILPDSNRWVIGSASRLIIHGYTNVNRFRCSLSCYNGDDTLEYVLGRNTRDLVFIRNQMVVPVHDFGCGNGLITEDFLETLKAEQYPYIRIHLLSLSTNSQPLQNAKQVTGHVAITIAGVTKKYVLQYTVRNTPSGGILLEGTQGICFSDYNLQTPKKMLGLIQVREDLKVEFLLHMRPV